MQNYQKILEKILERIKTEGIRPKLLIHSCCAPCSSYVLQYLQSYFSISVIFHNPNIYPQQEYMRRLSELKGMVSQTGTDIDIIETDYNAEEFYRLTDGLESEKEGGNRCFLCYNMRLDKTAEYAAANGFDHFTTTLTVSPYKNAQKLNELGETAAKKYGVAFLHSDFKKNDGYLESIRLSQKYGLYRQEYCGCKFSYDAAAKKAERLEKQDKE